VRDGFLALAATARGRREGVEDEQGIHALLGQPMEQSAGLFEGYEIRILFRFHAPDVCRGHPGVPLESELRDELVGPEQATMG
jgi:hypothetical protein